MGRRIVIMNREWLSHSRDQEEKKMKKINAMKIFAAVLAVVLLAAALVGCSGKSDDLDYVKKKGKLTVGITNNPPMDYKEEGSSEWIGFDADMAKAFAASLGVEAEFIVVDWDYKIGALNGKTIDCVWNGMTLTDEVKNSMECTNPYFNNAQVVVTAGK